LVVYPKMIARRIGEELPFMATEAILMAAVARGGDRQELHERLRVLAMEAGRTVKEEGKPNDYMARVASDPHFGMTQKDLEAILDPKTFVGRAPSQVTEFIEQEVDPILERNKEALGAEEEVRV
ncbi:MAG: adenylosuccinate lyase, partial [Candidatus Latescibacterota bacterium]